MKREEKTPHQFTASIFFLVVGAGSLDVTGLLALVADALAASLGGAVTGNVANLAA